MSKELVKDRVIRYLIEDLLVPQDMIDTDVALGEFEEGAEGTLDVVVNVKDSQDFYAPVLIVHCMDEDVELAGEVVQKQLEYLEYVDNITMAGRLVLTNGDAMMYADWTGEEYDTDAALPNYETMTKEFFEMEEAIKAHEAEHAHGHDHEGCGCGSDCGCHGEDGHGCGGHEDGHECGCKK